MTSVCLFSSYSASEDISLYVRVYVEELQRHFDKLIFITNERKLNENAVEWLKKGNIELFSVKNEGFDFGMWYKAVQRYDCSGFDRVAFVNDSCVLYKRLDEVFDWINSGQYDYCGLVSSLRYSYHVQSYFVVMNKKAFSQVLKYMLENGIVTKYYEVIQKYEIGMNKYLIENGLSLGAMYESITINCKSNPSFYLLPQLIESGMPMIKKKILFRAYRPGENWGLILMNFNIDAFYYIKLIEKLNKGNLLIDLKLLIKQEGVKRNRMFLFFFNFCRYAVSLLKHLPLVRPLYKGLVVIKRKLFGRL